MPRKTSRGANKSETIRSFRLENPTLGPKATAEALSKEGTKVTPAFVSTVISNDRRRAKPAKRLGRPPASAVAKTVAKTADKNGVVAVSQLIQAKKLADRMGGVGSARAALDSLAKLLA